MSMHEEIVAAIHRAIEGLGDAVALSPTGVALAVQRAFIESPLEPHVQYASLEHFKQMARSALARRFDAEGEESIAHQGEMFSGQLQDRYPTPRKHGQEPTYKQRDALSQDELAWNIAMLRKSAAARLEHADALQAWADSRSFPNAA